MQRTATGLLRALGIDHHAWWGGLYEPHLGELSHGIIARAWLGVHCPYQPQRNGTKRGPGEDASPVYSGRVR
jgi:hypothetical protein